MEELDLLKKAWKKNENSFKQVSELEIYKMIHKSSSSVVKWILIIGIIEFIFMTTLGFFTADDNYFLMLKKYHIDIFMNIITILNYVIVVCFMLLFYRNFKAISTTDSSRKLMKNILKARKTVQYYVWYNLSMFAVIFFVVLLSTCYYDEKMSVMINDISHKDNAVWIWVVIIGMTLAMFTAMFAIFWLFYKLVYGFLLRKLHKNYQELKKIDL